MKLKLLGYKETSEHQDAGTREWQDHNEGQTNWALHFKSEDNKYFVVDVTSSYGSCGSGYCGASWGSISQIQSFDGVRDNIIPTKEEVFIEILANNKLNVQFKDPNEPYDAEIEQLLSIDGKLIAQSTGNGGCNYYPSGTASINMELFF